MQSDIFNLQTRLLTLERELADTSKETRNTGDSASKRIASTRAELDRLTREIQQMRGDVDALRVGVTTGQMPGTDPKQEGTLAATLSRLGERLDVIEQTQDEILNAISRAGLKKNNNKPAAKKAATLADLQRSFDAKRYKQVTEEAPKVVKEGAPGDRVRARYLYAESHFKLGDMRAAALAFNELLEAKPSRDLLPTVKMRLGDCFKNLGDTGTAKIFYEELIQEFPQSDEAGKAKERLAELGAGSTAQKG